MRITLHCLDCGFRFSVTMSAPDAVETVPGSLSCGQCGSRRWAAGWATVGPMPFRSGC